MTGGQAEAADVIGDLFASEGAGDYLGEAVTQAEHMLQAATLAERAGAGPALIAAALLHDVGHYTVGPGGSGRAAPREITVTGRELMRGTDNRHAERGAAWLGQWFGADVTEPVRLHVAAKRYLCTIEPGYMAQLSPASVYTLGVQGGPMPPEEIAGFEANPFARDACQVRRWDDLAKDPRACVPAFEHFAVILRALAR